MSVFAGHSCREI